MQTSAKSAFQEPRHMPGKLCLLVVEDNEADAYLIQRALSRHPGVGRIVHAVDGLAAEHMIERGEVEPDLAFIDLHMPRKDGFELLVSLACRTARSFPMVVLTSSNLPGDGVRSRLRGAFQVITKPASADDLEAVLHGAVTAVCSLGAASSGQGEDAGPTLAALAQELAALKVKDGEATREAGRSAKAATALRFAARIAQVGGWEMDFISELTSISPELRELFGGATPPEMPISNALLFWFEADRPAFIEALDQAIVHGRPLMFEGRAPAPDGSMKWWRLLGEPDFVGERCVALRGACQDITKWRTSEALADSAIVATDTMLTLVRTMSHEFRTPLNGVLGMAQVMASDELCGVQRQRLEVITTSGGTLLRLFDDLLDLSNLAAGKLELDWGEVDLQELADGMQSVFKALSAGKNLHMEVTLAASALGFWVGDARWLGQVMKHLISNAVKFTESGSVSVEISCAGGRLTISVRDTGVGIAADKLPFIFDRFVQVDGSMTRRHGGSGIGLTICRDLLALMGGQIKVESASGAGSLVTVSLPADRIPAARPALGAVEASEAVAARAGLRVLAADDNFLNQLALEDMLEETGIHPVMVGNGQEALDAWRSGTWDVILMDIQMPVMDGLSAAVAIRAAEREEKRHRTPIIAVTGHSAPRDLATYRAAGMDGCVAKPIDFSLLIQAIGAAVKPAGAPTDKAVGSGLGRDATETTEGLVHHLTPQRFAPGLANEKDDAPRRHLLLLLAEERARASRGSATPAGAGPAQPR